MKKCLALLSGGLDSMLAIRLMQEQNIQVEAINFKTAFTCCQDHAGQAARMLSVPLTVIQQDDQYFDLIREPEFGYGKGVNPCVDCRVYMFQKARAYMDHAGADFIVSGEVVGQRPKSQKKRDLEAIAFHSDLDGLLVRPLSAKLLPPTVPETNGWIDRDQLLDVCGRGRKPLIRLAKHFGFADIPSPSTGCALTEPHFSRKVFDLIRHEPSNQRWQFELLKYGRHFRIDESLKVIVGRNEADNAALEYIYQSAMDTPVALLTPHNFVGPCVLVTGRTDDDAVDVAGNLMLRYSKSNSTTKWLVQLRMPQENKIREIRHSREVAHYRTVAT